MKEFLQELNRATLAAYKERPGYVAEHYNIEQTVLAGGFISRNVFSAVRYMQMVGRGLRGEANGGTANCKIVTVVDNLGRFQDRHPYHYCEKYFS